jgi:WD40 repeat protein
VSNASAINESSTDATWKYWAFISYSHRDRKWADWLHAQLETYRVPTRLVGTPSRDGKVPARLFPVFRDREELAGASSLGGEIEEALRRSRSLIVICSPHAASSRWVGEEIKAFKAMGRESRVLSLIVEGEPCGGDGVECFPESLRFRVTSDREVTHEAEEPLAADARPTGDGRRHAFLKLLAGILDVPFDALRQRDEERRRRRLTIISTASVALMLVFAGIALYANLQRNEAERRRHIADSRQLAANAVNRLDRELDLALLLGVEATRAADTYEARSVLFTALTRHAVAFLPGPATPVTSLAFSPNGGQLAAGYTDGTIALWDLATDHLLRTLTAAATINIDDQKPRILGLGFSADAMRLSAVTDHGSIQSWNLATSEATPSREPVEAMVTLLDGVTIARFDRDATRVAIGSEHGRILVWDMTTHRQLAVLGESGPLIEDLAFSDDGQLLIAGGVGNMVPVWNVTTGKAARVIATSERFRVTAVGISPDGDQVATGGLDNAIELWQTASGSPFGDVPRRTGHTDAIAGLAFAPGGAWFATASSDRSIGVWNLFGTQAGRYLVGHHGETRSVTISRDGRRLASATRQGEVIVWETSLETPLGQQLVFDPDGVYDVAFSSDGAAIAVVKGRSLALFDSATRQPRPSSISSPANRVLLLAAASNGEWLGLSDQKGALGIWDFARSATRGAPRPATFEHLGAIAYNARRNIVAAAGSTSDNRRGRIALWNAATGDSIGEPIMVSNAAIASLAFDDAGKRLAAITEDGDIVVREIGAGATASVALKDVPHDLTAVAFAPDGTVVVAGTRTGTIAAWTLPDGTRLASFAASADKVTALAFSPDGRLLASSSDSAIVVSDFSAQAPLGPPIDAHISTIRRLAFSPDGRQLASIGHNQVFVWDVDPESWRQRACRIANREFTRAEWNRFLPGEPIAPCRSGPTH